MAFTSHGHQIPGTVAEPRHPDMAIARCGGFSICDTCAKEAGEAISKLGEEPTKLAEGETSLQENGDPTRGRLGTNEIVRRFKSHKAPDEPSRRSLKVLREHLVDMAEVLDGYLPPGRAKAIAMKNLEDTAMWAVKAFTEPWPLA